ncbi:Uncharacterised protein [Moraxella caprae]|uniref:Uncharacterized protein n=1 Tax=Moraxella caprae TaxID=90240 RepID=A0A378U4M2_9GAMM|nr:hypothetical protein [Moraxella caprae]STZ70245.1 Uncharacterised protein [Moraxella caprae]
MSDDFVYFESLYEQLFKNRYQGRKLDKIANGLYQLLTKQWKRA